MTDIVNTAPSVLTNTPTKPAKVIGLDIRRRWVDFFFRPEVVDFWSGIFLGSDVQYDRFQEEVGRALQSLGYADSKELREVAFVPGFLVRCRPMVFASRKQAVGTVFFAYVDNMIYVSLRVMYKPFIDMLKFAVHLALILLPPLVLVINARGVSCSYDYAYGELVCSQPSDEDLYLLWLYGAIGVGFYLTLFRMVVSWLTTRSWWAWLCESMSELHRDDLAMLGQVSYACIVSAADALSLERVQSKTQEIPPTFAAVTPNRRRRI